MFIVLERWCECNCCQTSIDGESPIFPGCYSTIPNVSLAIWGCISLFCVIGDDYDFTSFGYPITSGNQETRNQYGTSILDRPVTSTDELQWSLCYLVVSKVFLELASRFHVCTFYSLGVNCNRTLQAGLPVSIAIPLYNGVVNQQCVWAADNQQVFCTDHLLLTSQHLLVEWGRITHLFRVLCHHETFTPVSSSWV